MPLRIEVLGRHHRALLEDFRNQHQSLVDYLRRFALRHAEKDLLARTFLAIDVNVATGAERLAGYFTLATASVERAAVSSVESLDRLPGFPIPAVLLARLAVDERVQGQGLGRALAAAARHLVPEDRPVWAQIAPGNAASVRAFLAAGYSPIGAEALLVT